MNFALEIERVWLLRGMPLLPTGHENLQIVQGYLLGDRGESAGRIRRTVRADESEQFHHNCKKGSGLVREESESEIDSDAFARLWSQTAGRRVRKCRHRVPSAGLIWEIDEFSDFPLVLAEVELPGIDHAPVIPSWLTPCIVREVTEDPRYRNYNLATMGPPPETAGG